MPLDTARRSLLLAGLGLVAGALPWRASAQTATRPGAPGRIDWVSQPLRLMMVEARDCEFCAAWRREIGPGYAGSAAGRAAPVLSVDIDGPFPDGLVLDLRPRVTPSFILLSRGAEVARLEGYSEASAFHAGIGAMLGHATRRGAEGRA